MHFLYSVCKISLLVHCHIIHLATDFLGIPCLSCYYVLLLCMATYVYLLYRIIIQLCVTSEIAASTQNHSTSCPRTSGLIGRDASCSSMTHPASARRATKSKLQHSSTARENPHRTSWHQLTSPQKTGRPSSPSSPNLTISSEYARTLYLSTFTSTAVPKRKASRPKNSLLAYIS